MKVRVEIEWLLKLPEEVVDIEGHLEAMMAELEQKPMVDWPGKIAVMRVDEVNPWEATFLDED